MKHGLVRRVADWPYSLFHRHVRQGLLTNDWAGSPLAADLEFGEPEFQFIGGTPTMDAAYSSKTGAF